MIFKVPCTKCSFANNMEINVSDIDSIGYGKSFVHEQSCDKCGTKLTVKLSKNISVQDIIANEEKNG